MEPSFRRSSFRRCIQSLWWGRRRACVDAVPFSSLSLSYSTIQYVVQAGCPTIGNYCTRLSHRQKMSNDKQKSFRHVRTYKMNNFV